MKSMLSLKRLLRKLSPFSIDNHSISGKLFIIVYATVAFLSISLGFLAYFMARNIVIKSVSNNELRFVQEVSNIIDEEIVSLKNQVESLAFDQGLNELLLFDLVDSTDKTRYAVYDQIERMVFTTNARKEAFLSLVVLSLKNGMLAFIGDTQVTHRIDMERLFRNFPWYTELLQSDQRWLWLGYEYSGIFNPGFREQRHLSMVHTVMNLRRYPNYVPIGMIHVVLNSKNLVNKARSVIGDDNKSLIVLDDQGLVIVSLDNELIGKDYSRSPYFDVIQERYPSSRIVGEGKSQVLQIYHFDDRYGWHYIQEIPMEYVHIALQPSVIIIIVMVFLALVVAYLIIRLEVGRALDPLRNLMETMSSIGEGETTKRFTYQSDDEIGVLGNTFNIMMAKLSAAEQEKRRKEFEVLQAQINPHFLYNTLNTIRLMAIAQQNLDIRYAMSSLIHLFRNTIGKEGLFTTISDEVTTIKHYVTLMQLRYANMFTVEYDIDNEISSNKILRFLIQPIIENAIFHGFNNLQDRKGFIQIRAQTDGHILHISITDNGIGIQEEKIDSIFDNSFCVPGSRETPNIGIKNVHERIKLYHGGSYGMEIERKRDIGTKITLLLPLLGEESDISRFPQNSEET